MTNTKPGDNQPQAGSKPADTTAKHDAGGKPADATTAKQDAGHKLSNQANSTKAADSAQAASAGTKTDSSVVSPVPKADDKSKQPATTHDGITASTQSAVETNPLHREAWSAQANISQEKPHANQEQAGRHSLDMPSLYPAQDSSRKDAYDSADKHPGLDKLGHKTTTTIADGHIHHHTDDGTVDGTTFDITSKGLDAHLGDGAHFSRDFETKSITYDLGKKGIYFKQEVDGDCELKTLMEHFKRKGGALYKVDTSGHLVALPDSEVTVKGVTLTGTITKFDDGTEIDSKGEAKLYTGDISHSDNSIDFADGKHVSADGKVTNADGSPVGDAHFYGSSGAVTYGPEQAQAMEHNAEVAVNSGSASESDIDASMGQIWSLIAQNRDNPAAQNRLAGLLDMLIGKKDKLMAEAQQKKLQEEGHKTKLP